RVAIEQDDGDAVRARDRVARGLEPNEPRVCRGAADRAAAIRADRNGTEAGRNRCDRTATGAARRQCEIPRIARDAEQQVVGVALESELGAIGLAENDRAALAQFRDWQLVLLRNPVGIDATAPGRTHAADRDVVFHGERDAIEGAE